MNDAPYSNRELDSLFKNHEEQMKLSFKQVFNKIDEAKKDLSKDLQRVETQTLKTNGRVSSLEGWRNWITGGLAVFTTIIVPTLIWILNKISIPH